jgi:polyphenol oxidase
MILSRQAGITMMRFSALDREPVRHGVFTREGGESTGPFAGLNTALSVGDRPDAVLRNREAIRRAMGGGRLRLVRQVHGSTVRVVDSEEPDGGEADALVTDQPDCLLVIQVADCQPVLLYDPVRRVVANVHSGWRGSIRNVVGKTVAVMADRFGVDPRTVVAGIGPSLGPCCAEFIHYRKEIPERYWGYRDGIRRFDFRAVTRDQLRAAGLDPSNIHDSGICTRCNPHLFFSYRGEKTTGRFAAVIGLAAH